MLGLDLATLSQELRTRYNISTSVKGVVITGVDSASDAGQKKLTPGDVIVEIDRSPTTSSEQAVSALRASPKGGQAGHLLRVRSAAGTRFVTVK